MLISFNFVKILHVEYVSICLNSFKYSSMFLYLTWFWSHGHSLVPIIIQPSLSPVTRAPRFFTVPVLT